MPEEEANRVLAQLLGHVVHSMGAQRGAILLLEDEESPQLLSVGEAGSDDDAIAEMERAMCAATLRHGRPLILDDARSLDPAASFGAGWPAYAGVAAPVPGPDAPAGALAALGARPDWLPGAREIELLVIGAKLLTRALRALVAPVSVSRQVGQLQAELAAYDEETHEHCREVGDLACAVGRAFDLDPFALAELLFAAELHDLGKSALPRAILRKRGPLDEAEWDHVRRHPGLGAEMLAGVPGLAPVGWVVQHHHERWDGTGYPHGLARERIPLASRIVAACDAYLAMVRDRPYRPARSERSAIAELHAGAGTQWDPHVVEALVATLHDTALCALRRGARTAPSARGDGSRPGPRSADGARTAPRR